MATLRWGAVTHEGQLRTQNEDSHHVGNGLFVVADGMGGHLAGEVASEIAVSRLDSALPSDRVKNLEVVLRQRGLQAQVQETDFGPGRTVYRLMIGGLASREAAVNTGKKVQRLFREDDQVAALAR